MKKYIINTIYLISIVIIATSCNSSKPIEKEVIQNETEMNIIEITNSQFESSKMELGQISIQSFNESVKTNGYIDVPPANKATVSAIMGGHIKNSPLLIGDKVKKGQFLLTIENPDFIEIQQNYLEINEQIVYLKSEYERQKTLFDEKITSEKNYLKAESTYKSTIAMFKGLEQKLKILNINPINVKAGTITSVVSIYAPISGTVTAVYASVGKFMNTSDTILEIINDDHKHLELTVFEKDALKIKKGQTINFKIPESSLKVYEAEVHLVGTSIDEKRTVKVHGHLEDENEPFLVGMFVEAEIVTNFIQKAALPLNSIIKDDDKYAVLVLKEKTSTGYKFEKVEITIGLKNEEWLELLDTNSELLNKQILIKGVFIPLENS